jgi:SAM-dependent methyltransferase
MILHLSPGWQIRFACPICHNPMGPSLTHAGENAVQEVECQSCDVGCKVEDGIVKLSTADVFYDQHGFTSTGRDFGHGTAGRVALFFARHHYLYDISRSIPASSAVIELGCGGGSKYLSARYDMLGVDVSAASIRQAAVTYPSVVQGTAAELPVASSSVDAIISSCFLEHLGDDLIGGCLAEMNRVLRPGALMLHLLDLDTEGPFFGWAKRQQWFDPVFVRSRGHFGLRTLESWQHLLKMAGFEIKEKRLFCKTWLQDLSIWAALDSPFVAGAPRLLGRTAAFVRRVTGRGGDVCTTVTDDFVGLVLPDRWAAKAIIVVRKNS